MESLVALARAFRFIITDGDGDDSGVAMKTTGRCKSWTLDWTMDWTIWTDSILLIFKPGLGLGAMLGLGTTQESPQQQLADLQGNFALQ